MAWTLLPVVIAIAFSFNGSRLAHHLAGVLDAVVRGEHRARSWTTRCCARRWSQSFKLAGLTVLIAVPLGVAFALALDRWRGRVAASANFLMLFSFITPEIAIGIALFLFVTQVATGLGVGFTSQILGLSMYMMAYPVIVVRARLLSIGKEYEEAAMDLGASPTGAIRRVLLPLLMPAILASVAIVFAASIDNFVISSQLCLDQGCQTVPILIYTSRAPGTRSPRSTRSRASRSSAPRS